MPLVNKAFQGKLNLDTQAYRMPEGDYADALNIIRDAEGQGQDEVVSNIPGNFFVAYNMPPGINKSIGEFEDKVRNRIYYFVWNQFDHDTILYYDGVNGRIYTLVENIVDTGNEDVLQFDPSFRINHIDIIYSDLEGDKIFFTSGNSTPKKLNVKHILNGDYSVIKSAFIEVAKMPPLVPPTCIYGSDATRNSNSLRRKLFQFTQQWKYDDFESTSFSTYSKVPLPIGYYGSDNDIDSTFNNFITITVNTGDENVTDIIVAMRSNIGDAWSDFVNIASLNKAQLAIPDNSTYQFIFYNDALYPPIDQGAQYVDGVQTIPLFYWVPQLAYNQVLGNGNIPVYSAITEGYDNYPVSQLDVTITAENVTNIPPDTNPPTLTYTTNGTTWTFVVGGIVPEGTVFKIITNLGLFADYTSLPGDNASIVATGLVAYINANFPGYVDGFPPVPIFYILPPVPGFTVYDIQVDVAAGGGGTIQTEKTWLWDSNYIFGQVYVDEQNRDMPGVTTFINPVNSDRDYAVTTPSFSLLSADVQTPVITATVNHLPPAGAVKFNWVRRRQTFGSFLFYETCDFQSDATYYYFCLANIDQYKIDNSQFIYGTVPITNESRIKIIADITSSAYNGTLWTQDYQILGTVTRTVTGGSSPEDDRSFIKVTIPTSVPSPAYSVNMLVMIYTPMENPSTLDDSVYWEWGETYDIYTLDGVNYHRGKDQDQTATQPAIYVWAEGDVYFHQRNMYKNIAGASPYTADTLNIMDANFSDFFDSAVNDNGRGQAIEKNAKRQFNPTLIRNGGAYQNGTNISDTNVFYPEDFDEYDRSNGMIRRMFVEGRRLYIFQEFDIGIVPILTQIVRDTAGNPLEANSDILLNKITYPYVGKVGIGNVPESFWYGKGRKGGIDNNKGVAWRIGLDGSMEIISVVYKVNALFVAATKAYGNSLNNGYGETGQPYLGNPSINCTYNEYTNRAIMAFEEINRYDVDGNLIFHQDPFTISFSDVESNQRGFESFYSYHPELMGCLNNLLYTFKNGFLYLHSGGYHCNFYNFQYGAYIKVVFNQNILEKKTYTTLTQSGNILWPCTEITTQLLNQSGNPQQSTLTDQDFKLLESMWSATFKRDSGYGSTKYNGNTLKGNYIIIKFELAQAPNFVFLNAVSLKYITSYLTTV